MQKLMFKKNRLSKIIYGITQYLSNLSIFNKTFYGIILIVFIIITISSSISFIYLHNTNENEAMKNAVRLVNNINTGFQDNLDQVDKIIMSIYSDTGGTGSNVSIQDVLSTGNYENINDEYTALKATKDFFQRLIFLRKDFNSIYIHVSKNKIFSYSVNGTNKLEYVPTEEEWFKKTVAANGRTVITAPHIPFQLNYKKEVISFSRLLKSGSKADREPDVVVLIDLTLDSINNIVDKVNLSDTTGVMFLNNSGKKIYSKNTKYTNINLSKDITDKVLNEYDGKFTTNILNTKFLVAFNTSEVTGWKLLTLTPYSEVAKDDEKLIIFDLLLVLLALTITIFISFGFSKVVTKPIKRLQKGMEKVKQGNFDIQLQKPSNDELGQLVTSFNSMTFTIKTLIFEKYEEKLARNNAEFKYLQAQINPHFIYNTLQIISSMAMVKEVSEISDVSIGLAKILRYSMNTKNKIIPIKEEFENLICYLDIQKIRFKEILNYDIHIEDEVYEYGIIKLVLQPIVENSITHGIEQKGENGFIQIGASCVDGHIDIRIKDNGIGMSKEKLDELMVDINSSDENYIQPASTVNNNIGLRNINFRMKLVYGQEYGIRIESLQGEGTEVIVKIPARKLNGGD